MRGGRDDAARRATAVEATTSASKFGDYVKFDDMFGASCIFTAGDPAQVQHAREAYVKDTMERKLYGYVHTLETHGAPIQRIVVGGGCESLENRGGFPETRPRAEVMGYEQPSTLGDPFFTRKRARVGLAGGGGYGRPSNARTQQTQWPSFDGLNSRGMTPQHDGSLANLFDQSLGDEWEQDPLWAAMDSLNSPGVVGGPHHMNGALESDQHTTAPLPSGLKQSAGEDEFMRRARIELIEERLHSLEHRLQRAHASDGSGRVPEGKGDRSGSDKSNAFAGGFARLQNSDVDAMHTETPPTAVPAANLFQSGLFVDTMVREKDAEGDARKARSGGSGKSSGKSGGKSPQSPSPLHRAPYDPSRSRSQSDERGANNDGLKMWNGFTVSGGGTGEFPAVVPDDATFNDGGQNVGDRTQEKKQNSQDVAQRKLDKHRPHKVSTSFTSTPGPGSARGVRGLKDVANGIFTNSGGGESPVTAAARLMEENSVLSVERRRAKQERDMLLAEQEHNKAQALLLQASNARYEERVKQLEAMLRENTRGSGGVTRGSGGYVETGVNWGVAASEKEVAFDTHQNNAAGDAPSHKSLSKNASPVVSGLEGVSSG